MVQASVYFSGNAMCALSEIDIKYPISGKLQSDTVSVGYRKMLEYWHMSALSAAIELHQNYQHSTLSFVLYVFSVLFDCMVR